MYCTQGTKHLPTAVTSMSVTSMVKGTANVLSALRKRTLSSPSGAEYAAGSINTLNSLSSMQKRKRKMQNGSAECGDSKQKCHTSIIRSAVGRKNISVKVSRCTIIDRANPLMKVAEDYLPNVNPFGLV